jgi:ADP-heptose:LPS heptosyltransferase
VVTRREPVALAPPWAEADFPDSDGLVAVDVGDSRSIEAQINARPSMVRPAVRDFLSESPRSVLIQRVDQLGDLIVSIPAIRRLRELLPAARLVGLLSPANVDLGATLGLFDDIVVADVPENGASGRREMAAAAQQDLRRTLASYDFDAAIDLSENASLRPLLLLSGARQLFGFGTRDQPWLAAGLTAFARDPIDSLEAVSPGSRLVGMVEWLGAILSRHAQVMRRDDLGRDRLLAYGIAPGDRYVVLHSGARLAFSRWRYFDALAALIVERTDLKVLILGADSTDMSKSLASGDGSSGRIHRINGPLPFDDFDALLSFCDVMVGNDSGPKHLAALRGAKVISIHMARINWNEWGQNSGTIVSRRVPCAGCAIHDDPEDCGKGLACIANITAEEVFAAMEIGGKHSRQPGIDQSIS